MLVSFEGQDGAGKTALLDGVCAALSTRHVPAVAVGEFSDSVHGTRLLDALQRDRFLRPASHEAVTAITRTLEVVADLYYFDERVIEPAIRRGQVVLKDRHVDTILYTLTPVLRRCRALGNERTALTWLSELLRPLRRPDLTIYVDAPLLTRCQRLEQRGQPVSVNDLKVFAARERIVRRLIAKEPDRVVVVDNGERSLAEGVREASAEVCNRLVAGR